MATLQIRKKSVLTWLHIDSTLGDFILSQFYFSADNPKFQIVEIGQSKRREYEISDIIIYDDISSITYGPFSTKTELSIQLEALGYPAFNFSGGMILPPTTLAPYNVAKFIQKGYGNTNLFVYETGDIFCLWSNDGTIRIPEAIWNGGSLGDDANFTPIERVII
jgi:hypothetical protein